MTQQSATLQDAAFMKIVDLTRENGGHSLKVVRVGPMRLHIILRYATKNGYESIQLERHRHAETATKRAGRLSGILDSMK